LPLPLRCTILVRAGGQGKGDHQMTNARRGPRSFDAVTLGNRETDAWAAYYRHEWRTFLVAAVGMVGVGFGMGPVRTLAGAWHVLRANQLWAPYPDNDADGARDSMTRFYTLVTKDLGSDLDPVRAARLEVEWWRIHREHQYDPAVPGDLLVAALVDLYSYVYAASPDLVRAAATNRVEAMDLSDRWVANGCDLDDPLLAAERLKLVASHSALLDAAQRAVR
jgi:hypothetical protein